MIYNQPDILGFNQSLQKNNLKKVGYYESITQKRKRLYQKLSDNIFFEEGSVLYPFRLWNTFRDEQDLSNVSLKLFYEVLKKFVADFNNANKINNTNIKLIRKAEGYVLINAYFSGFVNEPLELQK